MSWETCDTQVAQENSIFWCFPLNLCPPNLTWSMYFTPVYVISLLVKIIYRKGCSVNDIISLEPCAICQLVLGFSCQLSQSMLEISLSLCLKRESLFYFMSLLFPVFRCSYHSGCHILLGIMATGCCGGHISFHFSWDISGLLCPSCGRIHPGRKCDTRPHHCKGFFGFVCHQCCCSISNSCFKLSGVRLLALRWTTLCHLDLFWPQ